MRTGKCIIIFILLWFPTAIFAQGYDSDYRFVRSGSYIKDKNFYLLTLFDKIPGLIKLFEGQNDLQILNKLKFNSGVKNFNEGTGEYNIAENFLLTKSEIDKIGNILQEIVKNEKSLNQVVEQHLRPSGYFSIYKSLDNGALINTAWIEAANGINRIIRVYCMGEKPSYPEIDSASYDIHSQRYQKILKSIATQSSVNLKDQPFYKPSLTFALKLLESNNRDEASRFEPLNKLENRLVTEYIENIDWDRYQYSVMIVPGAASRDPKVKLAPIAKERAKLAAERFKQGIAPLIIVSGGYVHPFQTPDCEALEMKKYLVKILKIPEEAIIIEPFARHTTTNVRNSTRLIYEYKIPVHKKALIVSTESQIKYIADKNFVARCLNEMRCIPFENLKQISSYEIEFNVLNDVLYRMALDPLDP